MRKPGRHQSAEARQLPRLSSVLAHHGCLTMARVTLYDRSRALIDDWQNGGSAPAHHADRLLLAEIFRLTGLETCQLPYPLRSSVVLQKMLGLGTPNQPGEPWFEACIEATTAYVARIGPDRAPRRIGKPKSALLLDLLICLGPIDPARPRTGAACSGIRPS